MEENKNISAENDVNSQHPWAVLQGTNTVWYLTVKVAAKILSGDVGMS